MQGRGFDVKTEDGEKGRRDTEQAARKRVAMEEEDGETSRRDTNQTARKSFGVKKRYEHELHRRVSGET